MKTSQLDRIVRAVEAKTSTAKARLGEARRRQAALLEEAERCDRESLLDLESADVADLVAADRRRSALERKSAQLRVEARAIDPEIAGRSADLKARLKEEIAWRRLHRRARAEDRKRRDAIDEERREAAATRSA